MNPIKLRCGPAAVTVRPELGSRITSLMVAGVEWIAQPTIDPTPVAVGSSFVRDAIGGWDEMLPTISGSPDHGEVWARSWRVDEVDDANVVTSVDLRTQPLTLTRHLRIDGERLTLDYVLECNPSSGNPTVFALWAAHPLLRACEIRLPEHIRGVVDVMPDGAPTRRPVWMPVGEAALHLDRLAPGTSAKYYVPFGVPVDHVLVVNRDGSALRWGWSHEVRYLGIWMDRGEFGPGNVVAPEPSNGAWDDVDLATEMGMVEQLSAGERRTWQVTVEWVTT